jgi:hypothetical protein
VSVAFGRSQDGRSVAVTEVSAGVKRVPDVARGRVRRNRACLTSCSVMRPDISQEGVSGPSRLISGSTRLPGTVRAPDDALGPAPTAPGRGRPGALARSTLRENARSTTGQDTGLRARLSRWVLARPQDVDELPLRTQAGLRFLSTPLHTALNRLKQQLLLICLPGERRPFR